MAKPKKKTHSKPRIQKRKSRRKLGAKVYKNYTQEMLDIACDAVASKQITSRDAERQFGIPRRTIVNKVNKCHLKPIGRPTILSDTEEKKIVKALVAAADFGCPLTKLDLQLIVFDYLKKNSKEALFNNKPPGKDWIQNFLRRHADELTVRVTQNISRARALKGPEEMAEYFCQLSHTLKDIPPENIVNLDETNLSDDPGTAKCIFRRGVRYPERVLNSTKGNISLMFTVTASGQCLPIYVVYKADNLYSEWVTGGPSDCRYNRTKSGWFERSVFEEYFETVILPWAQDTPGTKIVICDNLSSHLSVKIVELCESNNIKFVFIPSRSTHLTQPLDVAFFGPLKKAWRKILHRYKMQNPKQTLMNKKHFPKLLKELIEEINLHEAKNIKSGFRATGIFPLNPQEVLKRLPDQQEELLSYGIDEAFLNYLKETRTEKPMGEKRNQKIPCEAGKSVTVADINLYHQNKNIRKRVNKTKTKEQKSLTPKKSQINQVDDYNDGFLDDQTGMYVDFRAPTIETNSNKVDSQLISDDIRTNSSNQWYLDEETDKYVDTKDCRLISDDIRSNSNNQGYLDEETGEYVDTNAIDYDLINSWMRDDNSNGQEFHLYDEINTSFNSDSDATVTLNQPLKKEGKNKKFDVLRKKTEKEVKEEDITHEKISSKINMKQLCEPSTSKGQRQNNSKTFFRPFAYFDSDSDTDIEEFKNVQSPQAKSAQVKETKPLKIIEYVHPNETTTSQKTSIKSLVALSALKINTLLSNGHPPKPETLQNLPNTKINILEDIYLNEEQKYTITKIFHEPRKEKIMKKKQSKLNNDICCDSDSDESWNEYRHKIIANTDHTDISDEDDGNRYDSDKENWQNDNTRENLAIVGSYVLVRFTIKKNEKYYVGLIVKICDTASKSFQVRFLRKRSNNHFVWPQVDDVSFVLVEDIAAVLPKQNLDRRGKLTFAFNLSNYKVF